MNRVVLGMLLMGCAALFCCTKKPPPPNPAVPVNLYTATKQNVVYYDEYPATTQALSQVELRPQVQGYITGIFFKEGTYVPKGQKLYEIDERLYQDNYDAAVANLRVAQGNTVQAKQDADRYEYLIKNNAIAKQVLDHAVIALENAQNQEKAAEEAVKSARTNLTFSVINAPFSGIIGFSLVKLGTTASVGTTVLNTISTIDPMAVDFVINEKQLPRFEDLLRGKLRAVDSLFTILLPDNTKYPYKGSISVIDRAVDSGTGSIKIRLVFPNPENILRAGMSATVRVHNNNILPKLVIPGKAVVEQMGEFFVFVAKDTIMPVADSSKKETSDTAKPRPTLRAFQKKVQLGQTIGPNVIIDSGINEGDKVVIDGVQLIHEGSEITTSNGTRNANGKGKNGKQESGQGSNQEGKKDN